MVSKNECIAAINKFIKSKNINDAIILLDYLCDLKGLDNKQEALSKLSNPVLLSTLIPNILDELEREFNLVSITDKNNNLILVF